MAEQPEQEQPKAKGGMLGRLMIAGFMAAVIVGECAFAYFCIPSADEVAAKAQAANAEQNEEPGEGTEDPGEEEILADEVDLETYSITAHQPASETTMRIDFHLVGTVLAEETDEFKTLFERNKHRFREQVLFELRNSEITDLTDPGLGLIKRRILEKSNALFGKPVLQSVIFSDFSFVEQ